MTQRPKPLLIAKWGSITAALLMITAAAIAQEIPPPPADTPIRVETVLINVPIVVTDRDGRYVAGLKRQDFTIRLDGVDQSIEHFADAEAPVSVAIILDMSGSTEPYIKHIKKAAKAFVEKLGEGDQAMVMTFDQFQRIDTAADLTDDKRKLCDRIGSLKHRFEGRSFQHRDKGSYPDMYDAIYQAMRHKMGHITGRKAIVVLTDGFIMDQTVSPGTFDDMIVEGDTVIYPVMFLTEQHLGGRRGNRIAYVDLMNHQTAVPLRKMAARTGGRILIASEGTDFDKAFQSIGDELRKQYLLGFYPPDLKPPNSGKVALLVSDPSWAIRSKQVLRIKRVPR